MLDDRAGAATVMGQKLSRKTRAIVLLRKIIVFRHANGAHLTR
jgi:hypothetical protein